MRVYSGEWQPPPPPPTFPPRPLFTRWMTRATASGVATGDLLRAAQPSPPPRGGVSWVGWGLASGLGLDPLPPPKKGGEGVQRFQVNFQGISILFGIFAGEIIRSGRANLFGKKSVSLIPLLPQREYSLLCRCFGGKQRSRGQHKPRGHTGNQLGGSLFCTEGGGRSDPEAAGGLPAWGLTPSLLPPPPPGGGSNVFYLANH